MIISEALTLHLTQIQRLLARMAILKNREPKTEGPLGYSGAEEERTGEDRTIGVNMIPGC